MAPLMGQDRRHASPMRSLCLGPSGNFRRSRRCPRSQIRRWRRRSRGSRWGEPQDQTTGLVRNSGYGHRLWSEPSPRSSARWRSSAGGQPAFGQPRSSFFPSQDGDPDQPLQKRPTTLLPVIYRLWARLRLRQVDAWRAGWDPAVASLPKGPEGQAWGLAWELAVAPAWGHTVSGAAVDLTKCYDSVRHPLLRRALGAAGWPTGILEPLLAAYSAPRRLRVGDAIGRLTPPRAGLPAGCPIAVSALAVLTWPWQVAVSRAGATSARRYADDLTAWVRGPPIEGSSQVVAIWSATTAFATAAQLALNQAKSGVFSGCDRTRAQLLASAHGAQLLRTFKDLGVQQLVGGGAQQLLEQRIRATAGRFER